METQCVNLLVMAFLIAQLFNSIRIPYTPGFVIGCCQKNRGRMMELNVVNSISVPLHFDGFLLLKIWVESPHENLSEYISRYNIRGKCRDLPNVRINVNVAYLISAL